MDELDVRVVGEGTGPLVVLLHGFGAPGDDLVPIAEELALGPECRFVFPAAPLSLSEAGLWDARAWWMINMQRLEQAMLSGEPRDQSRDVPVGMDTARQLVVQLLDRLMDRHNPRPLVLGGFSQGAMLALDVALRTDIPLSGLALMSGTLLAEHEWLPLMSKRAGLPVLQSHGRQDPLLPFAAADRLRGLLVDAGLEVDWIPFDGQHTIPVPVMQRLRGFLSTVLDTGAGAR